MKTKITNILFAFALIYTFSGFASAQFIKIPKIEKPTITTQKPPVTTQTNLTTQVTTTTNDTAALPQTTILKPTLRVFTLSDQRYWKQPTLDNFWCWIPRIVFEVSGPIAKGTIFTGTFTTPDGKAWITTDSNPIGLDIPAGKTAEIEIGKLEYPPNTPHDPRASIATGTHNFKITMKNSGQEMYKGSFKVNKFFAGTDNPKFKNQYVFYVDQDWTLPIGYLWFDGTQVPKAPRLNVSMWFRGEFETIRGYLYYNGKQIASTETTSSGVARTGTSNFFSNGDEDEKVSWQNWQFTFFRVKSFDNTESANESHSFNNNPGNYEIKVLIDGELVRTTSFTVGNDGKVNDNGISANNGFGGFRMVLPIKVIPTKEGTLNLQAWKTDAFYGNPLSGFSVQ